MKAAPIIVTLLVCITALMVAHMVTEGHRYDVVAVGAVSQHFYFVWLTSVSRSKKRYL